MGESVRGDVAKNVEIRRRTTVAIPVVWKITTTLINIGHIKYDVRKRVRVDVVRERDFSVQLR